MTVWKAAIIGLGNIGMGYDYNRSDGSYILSHASGFYYHPSFKLVGAVDTVKSKRDAFEKKFKCPAFSSIRDLMKMCNPQVVSIAVPTKLHFSVFMETIEFGLKAIICEKPITDNVKQAKLMVSKSRLSDCALVVNYMRRFEPGVNELKKMITSLKKENIYKGTVWYSKGILNNGSHFIDLLRYLLGDVTEFEIINPGRKWEGVDPEPDVLLSFGKSRIIFLAGKEENFSLAEMELVGTKGKIRYEKEGNIIEYYKCVSDPVFHGYRILDDKPNHIPSDLKHAQIYVLNNLSDYLEGKSKCILSSGETALKTLDIVKKIVKKRNEVAK